MISEFFQTRPEAVVKHCKKGDVLQKAGEKEAKLYFVKKGLLRSYTLDEKGKEHIFMFAVEGWVISDIESLESGEETLLYIECLEDSEVIITDRKTVDFKSLDQKKFEDLIKPLFRRVGVMQRRIISLMSATARERFESFLEIYPDLPNRVPMKMIASYLGITPEALSAIRGKIARNK